MSIENTFKDIENLKVSLEGLLNEDIFKSYLFTLSNEEILQAFWKYIDDPNVYKYIRWNLVNRISANGAEKFKEFLNDLIRLIPIENYEIATKLRSVLGQSKEALPKNYLRRLFDILILNRRRNDRKLACWIARNHFEVKFEQKLFLAWEKYQDAQVIAPLIENERISIDSHFEIIEAILNDNKVEDWIKRKLFLLLAKNDFESIRFLEDLNPVTYLYIATKFKKTVDDKYVIETINNLSDSSLLGLVIWCVGKMGKRELLLKLSSDTDRINNLTLLN